MISIIVPVYNNPDGIQTTLESLLSQTVTNYRIVVVDNNSSDRTPEIVRSYEKEHDHLTLVHETEIQSSYAARNTAIHNTDSDLLAFVDADMTVPEDWLNRALNEFQSADADYMGCNVELTVPDDSPIPARYDHHTGFPVRQYLESQQFAPTCCLVTRRAVFNDVGLFDHRLDSGGDKEFGNRVHEAGYDCHFAEEVKMFHPTRNSVAALIKKDWRVGRGLCQLQRYHPECYGTPGVPPQPSGIKRPDRNLPTKDRLAFGVLSLLLTAVRGLGYYEEYLTR